MKNISYLALTVYIVFLLHSCSKLDDPDESIPIESIIELSSFYPDTVNDMGSIPADGNSYFLIKAKLGEKTKPNQNVVFATSEGLLTLLGQPESLGQQSLTVTAAYREATVVLHSGIIPSKEVLVSATVESYSNALSIQFSNAYPEQINVNPNFVYGKSTDTLIVRIEASRNSGFVSNGIIYYVQNLASDSISLNIPSYGILNDQQGSFKIINPLSKTGSIQLKITVPVSENDSIVKIVQVLYE